MSSTFSPSAFVSEAQQYKFPTGYFLLSDSIVVTLISSIVKVHLLMMTLILPKLKFMFRWLFSLTK